MRSDAVLELEGVGKTYPGGVDVLRDVSFTVRRGEMLGIVGPSGSGKSTLLHVMGTLDRATRGVVRVAGHDVAELGEGQLTGLRAREIGFVFQQFFLLDGMSALDNVAQGLLYSGVAHAERRRRAGEALRQVGLAHRRTHRPAELSGGERQRVAIARALLARPAIVFADEPTGNLDTVSGDAVVSLLRELHAGGTTIAVITHDRGLADGLPRRIELLDGRIERDTAGEVSAPCS
ncbi:MAG: ABC transporter ATP-binding protein [Baekduiaceae bacterium]